MDPPSKRKVPWWELALSRVQWEEPHGSSEPSGKLPTPPIRSKLSRAGPKGPRAPAASTRPSPSFQTGWRPSSAAVAWAQEVTHGGRALAIERQRASEPKAKRLAVPPRPRAAVEPRPRVRAEEFFLAAPAPRPASPRITTCDAEDDDNVVVFFGAPLSPSAKDVFELADTPVAGVAGLPLTEAGAAVPAPVPIAFALPPLVGDAAATSASGAIVPLASPPADATPPPSVNVLMDPSIRTNYHPPSIPTLPPGHGPKQANTRRKNLPTGALATCLVAPPHSSATPTRRFKGKGSKHANACPGPWVAALERMPPAPPTGSRRVAAGLADVDAPADSFKAVRAERAARSLVAILPWGSAAVILRDPPDRIHQRDPASVAESMVTILSTYGAASLEPAYSFLGRLLSWVAEHMPESDTIHGTEYGAFLQAVPQSSSSATACAWLRDWCGVDLPARAPIARISTRTTGTGTHDKESLSLYARLGVEWLAATHQSPIVRGQAAQWIAMMQSALRAEQASACVINTVTTHSYDGADFTILILAVLLDKNPNPAKRTSRPAWACIDELVSAPGTIVEALRASLDGAEGVRCLLRDTDSPTGDPTHLLTTRWIQAPMVDNKRVVASIQGLLRALGVDGDTASRFLGHSAKRFPLNAATASKRFSEPELNEIGRFGGSTAQSDDLTPVAAMLQAHALRCKVLPAIYAGKAKVAGAFDLLARLQLELRAATGRAKQGVAAPVIGGWGADGPFGRTPEPSHAPHTCETTLQPHSP
jgi:hypothetical protein